MRDKIEIPADLFLRATDFVPPGSPVGMELAPYRQIAKLPRYHFEGRRWFRTGPGHTITSLRLYENGSLVCEMRETGYGDQYLQMGINWLKREAEAGRCPPLPGEPSGTTRYVREELHGTYEVHDVQRERDL